MRESGRGAWFLLTGLVLGLLIGLAISFLIAPVQYAGIAPHMLNSQEKDQYRALVALAYLSDGDLGRAQARLALLRDENLVNLLSAQAQKSLASGIAPNEARALAKLADALRGLPSPTPELESPAPPSSEQNSEEVFFPSSTPEGTVNAIQTPTATPLASVTPLASPTPRVTSIPESLLNAPFILHDQAEICDPNLAAPLLMVEILDSSGTPIPGVKIEVTWADGQSIFYTGLHPRKDPGYADFTMQPTGVYSVRAGTRGVIVENLSVPTCTATDGSAYAGSWRIVFVAP